MLRRAPVRRAHLRRGQNLHLSLLRALGRQRQAHPRTRPEAHPSSLIRRCIRSRLFSLRNRLNEMFSLRLSTLTPFALVLALLPLPLACLAQTTPGGPMPPRSWVDKDTGHRVWRVSDEPNSGGFYFNVNAYTSDGKQMIYTAPDGIHVMGMATRTTKLLVANPPRPSDAKGPMYPGMLHALVAGYKTNSVFYTKTDPATGVTSVYKAD